jgi:hypothetical protein
VLIEAEHVLVITIFPGVEISIKFCRMICGKKNVIYDVTLIYILDIILNDDIKLKIYNARSFHIYFRIFLFFVFTSNKFFGTTSKYINKQIKFAT